MIRQSRGQSRALKQSRGQSRAAAATHVELICHRTMPIPPYRLIRDMGWPCVVSREIKYMINPVSCTLDMTCHCHLFRTGRRCGRSCTGSGCRPSRSRTT